MQTRIAATVFALWTASPLSVTAEPPQESAASLALRKLVIEELYPHNRTYRIVPCVAIAEDVQSANWQNPPRELLRGFQDLKALSECRAGLRRGDLGGVPVYLVVGDVRWKSLGAATISGAFWQGDELLSACSYELNQQSAKWSMDAAVPLVAGQACKRRDT